LFFPVLFAQNKEK